MQSSIFKICSDFKCVNGSTWFRVENRVSPKWIDTRFLKLPMLDKWGSIKEYGKQSKYKNEANWDSGLFTAASPLPYLKLKL